jgi:hypothetical protein
MIQDVDVVDELITEGEKTFKKHFIVGPFLQAELINKNKRKYPIDIMEGEVNRYIGEYVNRRRAYGELGHPPTPTINLDRASHLIVELKKEKNNFMGKAEVLDRLPMGKVVTGLLESKCQIAVSSRGLGTLIPTNEGYSTVQKDFRLATAGDIVADPSAPDAFVQGVMEGVDWVYQDGMGWVQQHAEDLRKKMHKESLTQIDEQAFLRFQAFLNTLVKR